MKNKITFKIMYENQFTVPTYDTTIFDNFDTAKNEAIKYLNENYDTFGSLKIAKIDQFVNGIYDKQIAFFNADCITNYKPE